MSHLTHFIGSLRTTKPLISTINSNLACVRYASKKASSSTRIKPGHPRPKHRGWKVQDGHFVEEKQILVTQLTPRFHAGLYVGMGRNGTLFAMERGKVMVTCEKINPNETPWAQRFYGGRGETPIYKKHFNVIPEPMHDRFILVGTV